MPSDNIQLYESDDVVAKYRANTTRLRSLNQAEKNFIDRFNIKDKNILVIGCGVGRVPANLLLYGNTVTGVDRSQRMYEAARKAFPEESFKKLKFVLADAAQLEEIPDDAFEVVFFPLNAIDYTDTYQEREHNILEAGRKLKKGGLFAFASHNKMAYAFSPKVSWKDRSWGSLARPYVFAKESTVGGGVIFKGNPPFIIRDTERITSYQFAGFVCDTRNKLDILLAKTLGTAQLVFPYLLYVFKK